MNAILASLYTHCTSRYFLYLRGEPIRVDTGDFRVPFSAFVADERTAFKINRLIIRRVNRWPFAVYVWTQTCVVIKNKPYTDFNGNTTAYAFNKRFGVLAVFETRNVYHCGGALATNTYRTLWKKGARSTQGITRMMFTFSRKIIKKKKYRQKPLFCTGLTAE